jgi:hypothetical protein
MPDCDSAPHMLLDKASTSKSSTSRHAGRKTEKNQGKSVQNITTVNMRQLQMCLLPHIVPPLTGSCLKHPYGGRHTMSCAGDTNDCSSLIVYNCYLLARTKN